jgi:hypothetical protein
MKNQSRHLSFASPEKKSLVTLVITASLLIGIIIPCRVPENNGHALHFK